MATIPYKQLRLSYMVTIGEAVSIIKYKIMAVLMSEDA